MPSLTMNLVRVWFGLVLCSAALAAVQGAESAKTLAAANAAETAAALKFLDNAGSATRGDAAGTLESRVGFVVEIGVDGRVTVTRGPARLGLQQAGYTPVLVKIINAASARAPLRITSPQAGLVFAGMAELSAEREHQPELRENENTEHRSDRFLELELFTQAPMSATLSGAPVEYAIALVYSTEAGRGDATIRFDLGPDLPDPQRRGELAVSFDITPATAVKLGVRDHDGTPTMGRFEFRDQLGHVYPPQSKRLAPDFFFQKHVYRGDGETVLLAPGEYTMWSGRGPEYRWQQRSITVPAAREAAIAVRLERWVEPARFGFYCGDLHLHAAGCAHYTYPTQGVAPADMIRQVKGEGLNVGGVLTWAYGFEEQSQHFSPGADSRSEPYTVIKFDLEVSGFGSAALGHLCLLNLRELVYPGATASKGWPTWTIPILRWAHEQGGVTGYPHSAGGLRINPASSARRLTAELDRDGDGLIDRTEAARGLLPEPFAAMDLNGDGKVSAGEMTASHDRVADELPNFAVPEMSGGGAMELFVSTPLGLCDFITTMDTDRICEWNAWYHLMNCGLPLKACGESDFPCMASTRAGQGRAYVQLGRQDHVDYAAWCRALGRGQSYMSDGYAHALEFAVGGKPMGGELRLDRAGKVNVTALVSFSPETPLESIYGGGIPATGRRSVGDTVVLYPTRSIDPLYQRGVRLVEIVVNGRVAASREVPADGLEHRLEFSVPIERSSWVALREFPQLHTNPVYVLLADKPIRASRESALWAMACVDQLWRFKHLRIAPAERAEAERTYGEARSYYQRIADESPVAAAAAASP